jgi:hypothetical protein
MPGLSSHTACAGRPPGTAAAAACRAAPVTAAADHSRPREPPCLGPHQVRLACGGEGDCLRRGGDLIGPAASRDDTEMGIVLGRQFAMLCSRNGDGEHNETAKHNKSIPVCICNCWDRYRHTRLRLLAGGWCMGPELNCQLSDPAARATSASSRDGLDVAWQNTFQPTWHVHNPHIPQCCVLISISVCTSHHQTSAAIHPALGTAPKQRPAAAGNTKRAYLC